MDETKVHIQNQLWKERLSSALENCYHQVGEKNHCDVSIVTEDGIFVKAHKLVLAIGSGYFRAALQGVSEHQYPIVELPNIASEELLYLIEFMYNGRTSVDKCVLKKVLDASQMLDIKSLSHVPNDESFQTYMAEWDDVDSHVRSDPPTQLALPTARRSLVTPEAPQVESDAVKSLFLDKTSNGQLTAQGYEEQLLGMDLSLSRGQAGPFARHIPMSVDDAPTKHNIDFHGGPSKRPNNNNFGSSSAKVAARKDSSDCAEESAEADLNLSSIDGTLTLSLVPEAASRPGAEERKFATEQVAAPLKSKTTKKKKKKKKKFPAIDPVALFTLPAPKAKGKQTRISLALEEKIKVIRSFVDGKSQRQIASAYGIGKTQVNGIIKKREEILTFYRESAERGDKLTVKRKRRSEYSTLNEHLIQWYRHMSVVAAVKITTGMLRAKALEIAPELGYSDFKASNGWLATFKSNNNLKFSKAKKVSESYSNDSYEEEEQEYFQDDDVDSDDVTINVPHDTCGNNVGVAKPPMTNMALTPNLSAPYNLTRDHARPPDVPVLSDLHPVSGNPLAAASHSSLPKPDLSYKSEESIAYGYDPQARMNEGTSSRPSEYNYAHYGFPSSYYGYHFLGQY